jgi:hypothetical protein
MPPGIPFRASPSISMALGDVVRLTVTHDELTPDMRRKTSNGWPRVLSSLKSLLETGRPPDVYA